MPASEKSWHRRRPGYPPDGASSCGASLGRTTGGTSVGGGGGGSVGTGASVGTAVGIGASVGTGVAVGTATSVGISVAISTGTSVAGSISGSSDGGVATINGRLSMDAALPLGSSHISSSAMPPTSVPAAGLVITTATYRSLFEVWLRVLDVPPEKAEGLRTAYGRDVAVLPADRVGGIIRAAGFEPPIQFLQTGLIHAWYARAEHPRER